MIRVFTDFNARTSNGNCWILHYRDADLSGQIEALRLKVGDRILLYQDDDFEVIASLDFQYVDVLGRSEWIAVPDWSTFVRK